MAPGYSISALSPLGNIGLGATGAYSSYDPYMMMPNYYGGTYNDSIYSGMYGMYNPTYWTQMQQQIEQSQLAHASKMHTGLKNNEVTAHRTSASTLIDKILTNGSETREVQNLYQKVKEGDLKGVCDQFDILQNTLLRRYPKEFDAMGDKINKKQASAEVIERLYSSIISAQTGEIANLRQDIERFGDGAFTNGFLQGMNTGHHNMYVDEALNHCYGTRIDSKDSKDFAQSAGKLFGGVGHACKDSLLGAGAAVAIAGTTVGAGKLIIPKGWLEKMKNIKIGSKTPFANASTWQTLKKAGKIGAAIGFIYGGYKAIKSCT